MLLRHNQIQGWQIAISNAYLQILSWGKWSFVLFLFLFFFASFCLFVVFCFQGYLSTFLKGQEKCRKEKKRDFSAKWKI